MPLILTALLAAAAQPAAVTAAVPAGRFTDLPNIAVTTYDVTGRNVREVHASIAEQAPKDPATQRPIPATSDWSIAAAVDTLTTGGQCQIGGVRLKFSGSARMPHLIAPPTGEPIAPELQAAWNAYVAALEARQVAQLRFAHDRLGQVEQAIRASGCANWKAATAAALNRIKAEQAAARAADPTPPPQLMIPTKENQKEQPPAVDGRASRP